jgi:hypothetical protein
MSNFANLRFRAIYDNAPLAKIDLSGFTIEGDPIAFVNDFARNRRRSGARIDGKARATDDTGLSKLAGDDPGVGGPAADCR